MRLLLSFFAAEDSIDRGHRQQEKLSTCVVAAFLLSKLEVVKLSHFSVEGKTDVAGPLHRTGQKMRTLPEH
jgi:hypothetical protein